MIPLTDYIGSNVFVREVKMSIATTKLQDAFKENEIWDQDVRYFHAMIKYPGWHRAIDIFKFLHKKAIKKLRKDPKLFYVLDASTEGFSTIYGNTPFFDILYFNCEKYRIPPKKVIFFSSNMVDEENLIRFNYENKIEASINVCSFHNFEHMLFGLKDYTQIYGMNLPKIHGYHVDDNDFVNKLADERYLDVLKHSKRFYYGEKYFLSLSRVPRPHRILSAYDLFNSDIFEKGIVSCGPIPGKDKTEHFHQILPENCEITLEQLQKFRKQLPLIADTEDFDTNHAMSLHSHLHWSTLFQVVGETFTEDWHGTSRFWREKTFRAIFHMEPFIIWGQPNANRNLEKYGYKLYETMFDYDYFDSEQDTTKRWHKLLEVIKDSVKYLNSLDKQKQLEWKFKEQEVLRHNYKVMYCNTHTRTVMSDLSLKLKAIIDDA